MRQAARRTARAGCRKNAEARTPSGLNGLTQPARSMIRTLRILLHQRACCGSYKGATVESRAGDEGPVEPPGRSARPRQASVRARLAGVHHAAIKPRRVFRRVHAQAACTRGRQMIAHGLEPSAFVISKERATPATVPIIGPFFTTTRCLSARSIYCHRAERHPIPGLFLSAAASPMTMVTPEQERRHAAPRP